MITSVDNRHVREVVSLRRSRERRRLGLFVAEGPREVERARSAGLRIVETFFAPALLAWNEGEPVSERVLARMAYRAEPEGVIAVVEAPRRELPPNGSLYLVAVGVEKPGNLGAMARSAAAAGADALLVAEARVDAWNPNAIRASTGAVFSLPIVEATLAQVAELGVSIVAASPAARLDLHECRPDGSDGDRGRRRGRRARRRLVGRSRTRALRSPSPPAASTA